MNLENKIEIYGDETREFLDALPSDTFLYMDSKPLGGRMSEIAARARANMDLYNDEIYCNILISDPQAGAPEIYFHPHVKIPDG